MELYQIDSLIDQITSNTDRLALRFSDPYSVTDAVSRQALYRDIWDNIRELYIYSHIDSLTRDQMFDLLSDAYIYGGLK